MSLDYICLFLENNKNINMKTEGEKVMRTEFNPSKLDKITEIKNFYADLYNNVNDMKNDSDDNNEEFLMSKEQALINLKSSCMFAVNALTVNF